MDLIPDQPAFDRTLPFNAPTLWFDRPSIRNPPPLAEVRTLMPDGYERWLAALRHLRAFLEVENNPDRLDRTIVVLPVVHASPDGGGMLVNHITRGAAWYLPRVDAMITHDLAIGPVLDRLDPMSDAELREWWGSPAYWDELGHVISETQREVDDIFGWNVFTLAGVDLDEALTWLAGPKSLIGRIVDKNLP
jgi:hypothetical protein